MDCKLDFDPEFRWTPAKRRKLGASLFPVLNYMQPLLQSNDYSIWALLLAEDAYIEPTHEEP